jgi:DNA-binding PadR family transcriptional regulator
MQQLIKERGKDKVINVQRRGSLYQTIQQLVQAGLITVRETERDERRPERTIYELTAAGRDAAIAWMKDMLATPEPEFAEFPAAISFLPLLSPQEALQQLEHRQATLDQHLIDWRTALQQHSEQLPRLFLLEDEYLLARLEAEQRWVQQVIEDLRSGRLIWPRR